MEIVTPFDMSKLRPKSEVGYLAPEIAGEGERVIMSDGEVVNFLPPPAKPVMPDWSGIKSIRRYFGAYIHRPYPAWLYHPTEEPRLVKNETEAAALGVGFRDATIDERGRYGVKAVWDWSADSKWRATPWPGTLGFDPKKVGHGKTYIPSAPDPTIAQNELLRDLVPLVTASVAAAMKGTAAPAQIDPKQWEAFLAFQAFQKSVEAVETLRPIGAPGGDVMFDPDAPLGKPLSEAEQASNEAMSNALRPEEERKLWEAEAERKGVKVDGRWSLARLIDEIEKAA